MLKAIMFDLDDTLLWDEKSVKKAFEATCQLAVENYDIDAQQLEENVRIEAEKLYESYDTYEFTQRIGTGTFEAFWATYDDKGEGFSELKDIVDQYRIDSWYKGLLALDIEDKSLAIKLAEQFPVERKKHIYLYDETIEVLEKLKEKYQLLMLTNGSSGLQQLKLSLSPELKPYFDHIVISGDLGIGKPNLKIFEHSLRLLNVNKSETVMVGDNPMTDILGALQAGVDSIWINHHNQKLRDITPTYEVERLREIMPIINSLAES